MNDRRGVGNERENGSVETIASGSGRCCLVDGPEFRIACVSSGPRLRKVPQGTVGHYTRCCVCIELCQYLLSKTMSAPRVTNRPLFKYSRCSLDVDTLTAILFNWWSAKCHSFAVITPLSVEIKRQTRCDVLSHVLLLQFDVFHNGCILQQLTVFWRLSVKCFSYRITFGKHVAVIQRLLYLNQPLKMSSSRRWRLFLLICGITMSCAQRIRVPILLYDDSIEIDIFPVCHATWIISFALKRLAMWWTNMHSKNRNPGR